MTSFTFNTEDNSVDAGQVQDASNQGDNQDNKPDTMTAEEIQEIVKRDMHAQHHIKNLESENKGMREEMSNLQKGFEELKDKLASQDIVQQLIERTQQNDSVNNKQDKEVEDNNNNNFDNNTINEMVKEQLNKFMESKEKSSNLDSVKKELGGMFKGKADDHVRSVAEKNGMSFDDAMDLASNNPKLFSSVFVEPFKNSPSIPSPTSANNNSSAPATGENLTMEHWNKLRKENPNKFFSVDVQKQYHKWFAEKREN